MATATATLWSRSGQIEFDNNGSLARGACVEFSDGGTTIPRPVYGSSDETQPLGHKVTVDGNARWPPIFISTGFPYTARIVAGDGTFLAETPNVPNPPTTGGSGGGGGSGFVTGMLVWMPRDGQETGWVRCNGRTIGSASSIATEYTGADSLALFTLLWNNSTQETNPVSGGSRGTSASADFSANKTIQLPDMRAGGPLGLDGMGNTAGNFLAATPFATGGPGTANSLAGNASTVITEAELPVHSHGGGSLTADAVANHSHNSAGLSISAAGAHTHSGTTGNVNANHTHQATVVTSANAGTANGGTGASVVTSLNSSVITTAGESNSHQHGFTTASAGSHSHGITGETAASGGHGHSISGATDNVGTGAAFNLTQRSVLGTWYLKL